MASMAPVQVAMARLGMVAVLRMITSGRATVRLITTSNIRPNLMVWLRVFIFLLLLY